VLTSDSYQGIAFSDAVDPRRDNSALAAGAARPHRL